MNKILCILCFFLLSCSSTPPVDTPEWVGKLKNACLPEAIVMCEGLNKSGVQAKVLSIHTKNWGHAVCVYMYPTGKNKLWAWDSYWQSIPLRAWFDDPMSIASAWMAWRHDDSEITMVYFH